VNSRAFYLAEVPHVLCLDFHCVGMFALVKVTQAVALTLQYDWAVLVARKRPVLKGLDVKTADDSADETYPKVLVGPTLLA